MPIHFACTHCGHPIQAEEFVAGKEITCPHCSKLTSVPGTEVTEKPRLKIRKQPQVIENISDAKKYCPECKAPADPHAMICVSCGHPFLQGRRPLNGKGKASGRHHSLQGNLRAAVQIAALAILVAVGWFGYILFQEARCNREIKEGLQIGNLSRVAEDYQMLASWQRWFGYLHRSNPYGLRDRQFQARQGKSYQNTKNIYFPLIVDRSVWGNRSQLTMKTAWVKFRFANLLAQPLVVNRRMFLLIGLDDNIAFADEVQEADPDPCALNKGEAIEGALYFGGIIRPPAFLEFNNGTLVVRAPVYVNYAMDNYDRDERDWPATGPAADAFPLSKQWTESKLTPKDVHILWSDYSRLPAPPAEPYTTVLKGANPR